MTSCLLRWWYGRPARRAARLVAVAAQRAGLTLHDMGLPYSLWRNRVGQYSIGDIHQTGSVLRSPAPIARRALAEIILSVRGQCPEGPVWNRRISRPAASTNIDDSYHIDPDLSITKCAYSNPSDVASWMSVVRIFGTTVTLDHWANHLRPGGMGVRAGHLPSEPMNRAVFRALKPGGLYVIADHAWRLGTGISESGTLHRIEEAFLCHEVEAAVRDLKAPTLPADLAPC